MVAQSFKIYIRPIYFLRDKDSIPGSSVGNIKARGIGAPDIRQDYSVPPMRCIPRALPPIV
jgi:hypothetical protein